MIQKGLKIKFIFFKVTIKYLFKMHLCESIFDHTLSHFYPAYY